MAGVIFDLDGTLIDSVADIRSAANATLDTAGVRPLSMDEARQFVGRGAPTFVARMIAARGLPETDHAGLLKTFLHHYEEAVTLTKPFPGVLDALEVLQSQGHRLAICTNKPLAPARRVLAHLDMARFFPVVVGGDSLASRKPDPAPLREAVERLDLRGAPALFVGDSEVDSETARAAGLPFLLYTEGYRHASIDSLRPNAAFSSWPEAPALIAECLG